MHIDKAFRRKIIAVDGIDVDGSIANARVWSFLTANTLDITEFQDEEGSLSYWNRAGNIAKLDPAERRMSLSLETVVLLLNEIVKSTFGNESFLYNSNYLSSFSPIRCQSEVLNLDDINAEISQSIQLPESMPDLSRITFDSIVLECCGISCSEGGCGGPNSNDDGSDRLYSRARALETEIGSAGPIWVYNAPVTAFETSPAIGLATENPIIVLNLSVGIGSPHAVAPVPTLAVVPAAGQVTARRGNVTKQAAEARREYESGRIAEAMGDSRFKQLFRRIQTVKQGKSHSVGRLISMGVPWAHVYFLVVDRMSSYIPWYFLC